MNPTADLDRWRVSEEPRNSVLQDQLLKCYIKIIKTIKMLRLPVWRRHVWQHSESTPIRPGVNPPFYITYYNLNWI